MSLEKTQVVDQIEVVNNMFVQVRTRTTVLENGNPVASSLHRHVIAPGDDYSGEDARVQAICAVTHTAEVVADYKAAIAAPGV